MFTSVRVRKVFRDIWANQSKTLMIVLATAVGVFAFGTLLQTWAILARDFTNGYAASQPAQATLLTDAIDEDLVKTVEHMAGVQAAQGRLFTRTRVWVPGTGWKVLVLIALHDFDKLSINQIRAQTGQWPPPKRTVLIERASLEPINAPVGAPLLLEMPDGKRRQLLVSGTVHDVIELPGALTDLAFYGYITVDTAIQLGLPDTYNQLSITVSDDAQNITHIQQVAKTVENRLKDEGHQVFGMQIPTPGHYALYSITQSLFLILNVLGIFTLLFSTLLTVNTISGLLTGHIQQIGVMKAIGAPNRDIIGMYVSIILVFSLLALCISTPLGVLGAGLLSFQLASLLNFDVHNFQMSPLVILLQICAGIFIPLGAAIMPIVRGSRTTVREAISTTNTDQFGNGLIDRILGQLQRGSAAVRYALRNMFRRKVRLALTLCALAVGGGIFITVLNTIASLQLTLNSDVARYWQQDITVNFQRPYRRERVVQAGLRIPGVTNAEGWATQMAFRAYPDGRQSREDVALFGPPADSAFIHPTLLAGRWLQPGDTQALVVNVFVTKKEPDLQLGSQYVLKINGRDTTWRIVGIVTSQMMGFAEVRPDMQIAYANYAALTHAIGEVDKVDRIVLKTATHSDSSTDTIVKAIEDDFDQRGLHIRSIETNARILSVVNRMIGILTALLTFAAVMFAAVGGLSLMSTMTLNVLERIREIGVLRAIGGSNQMIRAIILYEGAAVGLLSWLLGAILAIPLSWIMNYALGLAFFAVPLHNSFPLYGPLLWLFLAVTIALVASYLPARNASRLSVREILSYN
ncbi:MAG: ABC transporter permease [Chloroflexi bacterium]|nr:ABC transporter permease [Chloroflexota bacterium]